MKLDLDELERKAKSARPGPWAWFGNSKMHDVYLATIRGGRVFVMDFARWGMTNAQPRFQIDHRMVALGELAKAEHPLGPRFQVPYRRDFVGVGHPDAEHIAANDPSTTLALISRIRELEATLDGALDDWNSADPLDNWRAEMDAARAVLEKGVVIP